MEYSSNPIIHQTNSSNQHLDPSHSPEDRIESAFTDLSTADPDEINGVIRYDRSRAAQEMQQLEGTATSASRDRAHDSLVLEVDQEERQRRMFVRCRTYTAACLLFFGGFILTVVGAIHYWSDGLRHGLDIFVIGLISKFTQLQCIRHVCHQKEA